MGGGARPDRRRDAGRRPGPDDYGPVEPEIDDDYDDILFDSDRDYFEQLDAYREFGADLIDEDEGE